MYHARVDASTLEALQAKPDLFWELAEQSDPGGNQLLFTDKDINPDYESDPDEDDTDGHNVHRFTLW